MSHPATVFVTVFLFLSLLVCYLIITTYHLSLQLTIMRSPSVARLLLIGCVLLFPEAAFGRLYQVVYVVKPPTDNPTSAPSHQPSLRPSLQPTSHPSFSPTKSPVAVISSNLALAPSPYGNWWIAFMVFVLLCFVGAMYKCDKKQKLKEEQQKARKAAEEEPKEAPPVEESKGGWSAWVSSLWPGENNSSASGQPSNPLPPVEPAVETKTKKKTKKKGSTSTLSVAGDACVR